MVTGQYRMGSLWQRATMALAVLSFLLVIANSIMVVRNQSFQLEVGERQQIVNQGQQLARICQVLAQLLANLAVAHNDQDLVALMARHGLTVKSAATPAAPAPQRP